MQTEARNVQTTDSNPCSATPTTRRQVPIQKSYQDPLWLNGMPGFESIFKLYQNKYVHFISCYTILAGAARMYVYMLYEFLVNIIPSLCRI